MSKPKTDLKVFVTDEIIDFRTLEYKSKKDSPNFPVRTQSHNELGVNIESKPPTAYEREISSFEKLHNTLYSSTYIQEKLRKPKQKSRSKTVDPRFRRSRSPNPNSLSASQSNAELSSPPVQHNSAKKKSHSTSYLARNTINSTKPPIKSTDNQQEEESSASPSTQEIYRKATNQPVNYNNIAGKNIAKISRSEIEENTDLDPEHNIDSMEFKDIMKTLRVSNCENMEKRELLLNDPDKISPYWDDPRLLEKHNAIIRPIPTQRIKSATTLPILPNCSRSNSDLLWQNYLASQHDSPIYQFDDTTDICNCSLINDINMNALTKSFYKKEQKYSTCGLYIFLGSVCGILFVCSIGWLLTHNLWNFWSTQAATPKDEGLLFYFKSISATVLYGLEFVCSKLYTLFMISRSEILNNNPIDQGPWWMNII